MPPRALSLISSRKEALCANRTAPKALAFSASGQIVVAATALISLRVYTELLDKAEFALAMMAMGGVALLDGVVVMALNQTLLSLCAALDGCERQREVATRLGWRLARLVVLVMAGLSAVLVAARFIIPLHPLIFFAPLLIVVYLGEEIAKTTMLGPMTARREYPRFSLWAAVEAVVTLAVIAATLKMLRPDAVGFLIGLLAARLATTTGFMILFFGFSYFSGATQAPERKEVARALTYGLPLSVMAPLGWLNAFLDRYAIAFFSGLSSAAVYTAASGLVGRPYAITTSVLTNYFRPLLFEAPGAGDARSRKRRLAQWLTAASVIGFAGVAALALLAKFVAALILAPDFRAGATPILTVLGVAQTFAIMTHALDNAILATGTSGRLLKLQAAMVVPALVLVPLGALLASGFGAALGRMASEAIRFGATVLLSRAALEPPPTKTSWSAAPCGS